MFVLGTIYNKQIEIQDELRQLYKHTASREGQARIMSKLEEMQPSLDPTRNTDVTSRHQGGAPLSSLPKSSKNF